VNACTVIAWNYLAHARVLATSFLHHHPSGRFSVLLLDDPGGEFSDDGEDFELVRPADIMEPREFHRMSLMYELTELATAVKPWLLRHLLARGESDIVFFDPDIQVFAPLDDIAELAQANSIVLTPHDTIPTPRDNLAPSELHLLQSGTYNLGFIALGRGASGFLDWWSARLRRHCVASPEQGLFVDQRWVDFVPAYFDHYILKDPGCNVAYWNLCNRKIGWNGDGYRVNGEPLRFFHFSGYTPDKPHLLTRHAQPSPRILLSERPHVQRICDSYAEQLFEHGYRDSSKRAYGLDALGNGLRMDRRMRHLYRDAILLFEQGTGEEPPDAFENPDAFVRWLNEPVAGSPAARVSRYLQTIYGERPDLQTAFPNFSGPGASLYLRWVCGAGREEEKIPESLLPKFSPSERGSEAARYTMRLRPGVNMVGYFRAELGVGEAARQLLLALEKAQIPLGTTTVGETLSRQSHPFEERDSETPYDINIVCVNADMLSQVAKRLGPEFFEGRYTIGLWHWEVSTFPERWYGAFDHVDEIWVASEHAASSISPVSTKPVHVVPLPVTAPPSPGLTRAELGLPDGFLFLFLYDFMSVFERKNPFALIDAFRRAFSPTEGPKLVLKSINGDQQIDSLERLRLAAAGHPDVTVIDGYLSSGATKALIAHCDCYVSLHRAEGFGLSMAEAMALGKPVVATGFSGNLAYMDETNAYLVRHRLEPIPEGCAPYPADGEWACPDVDQAAELLRRVYTRREEAIEKGRRAREHILAHHSVETCGKWIERRLANIRAQRLNPRDAPPPLARAQSRAAVFPGTEWKVRSRYRPILPALRTFLFRLMSPYTEGLRELHHTSLEAIAELGRRVDEMERGRILALRKEILERQSRETERLQGEIRDIGRRLRTVEAHLGQLASDVTAFQDTAKAHLASLTESLEADEATLGRLGAHLHALPYASESLRVPSDVDPRREVIGYHSTADDSGAPSDVYVGFENLFRGPETLIRDRLGVYLDIVQDRRPLIDLGCGRGELLDLIAATGMPGVGVDSNPGMVDLCRKKGHDVALEDAIDYLERQPDASFRCIFSSQLIEHLSLDSLLALFRLSTSKLASGGIFIAETVNPHSIAAMKCFWTDPSHQRPIFPEVAVALCRLHSFASARIVFPNGTGQLEQDLWEQGEYAVVATVAGMVERKSRRKKGSGVR
jgi:glycosyltransferase involved in cell wall biosynthesis/SAM-dependent methyltransferase